LATVGDVLSEDLPALTGLRHGSLVAGYQLEAQVGAGGMAVVFRARDQRLSRLVALKILAPALALDGAFRRRFIAESKAAAAVDDPHIIPVYEAGEASGVLFIAMRFVQGGDLRRVVEREGPLPPDRVAELIFPVAGALDAAHHAGLVHRDVKPANILVDARPGRPDHVYLSDFGLSKGAMSSASLTAAGQFLGTPEYSAPEQIQGRPVDGRTDQYALACVAFQLLTGGPPFEREQGMAVLLAHLNEQPPSLASRRPELPETVDQVLARALAKVPEQRYGSCLDFACALRRTLGQASYHSRSLTPVPGYRSAPIGSSSAAFPGPDATTAATAVGADNPATAAVMVPPPGRGSSASAEVPAARATSPGRDSAYAIAGAPPAAIAESAAMPSRARRPALTLSVLVVVMVLTVLGVGAYRLVASHPQGAGPPAAGATARPPTPRTNASAAKPKPSPTTTGPAVISLKNPGRLGGAASWGPGGTLAVGGAGGAYLWNISTRTVSAALTGSGHIDALSVAFGPGGTLAVADGTRTYLWNIASGKLTARLTDPASNGVISVAFAPGGTTLAVGDGNGSIYLWNVATRKIATTFTDPHSRGVAWVTFGPHGTTLAAGDSNGATYLWNVATRTISAVFTDPVSRGVESVVFGPRSTTLAVGDGIGRTYLWNTATGKLTATLTDPASSGVTSVAFAPGGTTLAVADGDGRTYLWNMITRKIVASLREPTSGNHWVAFSPSGATLAITDLNGGIHLWDVARYTA
jgi:serine/threonine protein kinase